MCKKIILEKVAQSNSGAHKPIRSLRVISQGNADFGGGQKLL